MADVGRPSSYVPRYAEQALKLARLGATDKEVADFFGVHEGTINAWKSAHPEFHESLNAGKMQADANVADRLYKRATGYSHEAVKIFMPTGADQPVYADYTEHYPPDTTAAIFWLKNRQPKKWRDKTETENKTTIAVDPAGADQRIIALLMKAGMTEDEARAALNANAG